MNAIQLYGVAGQLCRCRIHDHNYSVVGDYYKYCISDYDTVSLGSIIVSRT